MKNNQTEMQHVVIHKPHKPWYKRWWGIIIVLFIWPFFLTWFIWRKTKWHPVLKVAATIGIIVLTIGVGNALNANDTNTTASATPKAAENIPVDTEGTVFADQATTTPTPEPAKTWQKVFEFSGSGQKRSNTFTLTGADARLKYTVKGDVSYAMMAAYVLKDGDSLEKSGGFPEINAEQPGSDETRLVKDAGDYYLDVRSANSSWTITVEELR